MECGILDGSWNRRENEWKNWLNPNKVCSLLFCTKDNFFVWRIYHGHVNIRESWAKGIWELSCNICLFSVNIKLFQNKLKRKKARKSKSIQTLWLHQVGVADINLDYVRASRTSACLSPLPSFVSLSAMLDDCRSPRHPCFWAVLYCCLFLAYSPSTSYPRPNWTKTKPRTLKKEKIKKA